jgi:peroxiredoxin
MSLSRQQITLLGIFALFLGPVILVMLMRSAWWQYQPDGLRNLGYLVQPPVRLSLDHVQDIDRKWVVLYVLDPSCDKKCIEHVTTLRQIHRAAGRNSNQLAVVLLSSTGPDTALRSRLEAIYPEFNFVADPAGTALTTLGNINLELANKTGDSNSFHTYILDPMLNVILAYGVSANPNDIHKDLKRLLKWSDQENTQ